MPNSISNSDRRCKSKVENCILVEMLISCLQVLAAAPCGGPDCQLMADAGLHINGLHPVRLPGATYRAGATTHHFCLSGQLQGP